MESRWYQRDAIAAIFEYVQAGKTGAPLIALPTGTGKGFVIGEFVRQVMTYAPRTQVMMLTHVKELIVQNAAKLKEVWPLAPLGIYSAGLGQRVKGMPITFAGIASVYKRIHEFGHIDILVIDEAHLLSPDSASMYQTAIAGMKAINPFLFVVGLTATAYRMGQGLLTEGDGIFTDVIFDMTDMNGFNRLLAEGYLCPLYPKKTETTFDVSKVGISSNGDYIQSELEKAVDTPELTLKCLEETVYYGADRQCWMIFSSSIHHAESITDCLNRYFNVPTVVVHSKLKADTNHALGIKSNDEAFKAFKSGRARALVNVGKATTGFDHPPVDLIAHMRATLSTGLWVQMNGRGTRPSPDTGKHDCLALDFAGNTRRLGPINDPFIPRAKGKGAGDAPVRICEKCGTYNPASARVCFCCGHEFTFREKLVSTAGTEELIRSDAPKIEEFPIKRVFYTLARKKINNDDGTVSYGKPYINVDYIVGARKFRDFVFLDAPPGSHASRHSQNWWRERHSAEPPTPNTYSKEGLLVPGTCHPFPTATEAALSICSQLKTPKFVRVWINKSPYPQVMSVEY